MLRRLFIFSCLILVASRSYAGWIDNNNGAAGFGSQATVTATFPGNVNTNDVCLLGVATLTSSIITMSGGTGNAYTPVPITGDDGAGDHNITWNGGTGRAALISHVYTSGDSAPTINIASNTGKVSYEWVCSAFVNTVSPVDQAAGAAPAFTATSSSLTASFPSLTPSAKNEEMMLWGFGLWGLSAGVGTTQTYASTCGNKTAWGTTASSYGAGTPIAAISNNNPGQIWAQFNAGPCSPAAISGETIVATGSAGNNVGLAILLKPATFATQKHPLTGVAAQGSGVYMLQQAGNTGSWDMTAFSQPYLDGMTVEGYMAAIEPTCTGTGASATYWWDALDNLMIASMTKGLNVTLVPQSGNYTPYWGDGFSTDPVGAATQANITAGPASRTPGWVLGSNACNNSVAVPFIRGFWLQGTNGPPQLTLNYMFDVGDPHYTFAVDTFINDLAARFCAVSGGVCTRWTNIASVNVLGMGRQDDETEYNEGTDEAAAISGTSSAGQSDIALMTGDSDYPAGTTAPGLGFVIYPQTNNAAQDIFIASVSGTRSAQPNWGTSCATSCTDGSTTWVNKGQWNPVIQDGVQWGTLSTWTSSHSYHLGDIISDGTNTQIAITPGTSGTSTPTWSTTLCSTLPSTPCSTSTRANDVNGTFSASNGLVWQMLATGSTGHGKTINTFTCTGSDLCATFASGLETIANNIASKFGKAALNTRCCSSGTMPPSGFSSKVAGPCGAFGQNTLDPLTNALEVWYAANYPGENRMQENALGVHTGGSSITITGNLPYCLQPQVYSGFQTVTNQHSVGGASCTTPPLYSISATNCVPPMVYALLSTVANPYVEAYQPDLDTAATQGWFQLIHNIACANGLTC